MTKDGKGAQFLDSLSKYTIGANRGPLYGNPKTAEESGSEALEAPPPEVPLTKWQKVKRHFRRYWFCHLLFLIILLAILLPILFVFVVPAIAQDLLNRGTITLDSATISQPRPSSVLLSLVASIYIPGGFTVHTDPTTLGIYAPDQNTTAPFANLGLGPNTVKGNTTTSVMDQHTPFLNETGWQVFVNETVNKNSGSLGLIGPITAHIGKLVAHLNMNKQVPSLALNQFKGFTIDSAQLLLPAESDGTNLLANATLPNQSILTLEIGNTTLNLLSCDLVIGKAYIDNMVINPGNNTYSLRGVADLKTLISNLGSIIKCQAPALRNGYLQLTSKVTNITWEDEVVPYYLSAIGGISLTAETSLLGLIISTLKGILNSPAASKPGGLLGGLNSTGILNGTSLAALHSLSSRNMLSHLVDNEPEVLESLAKRYLENFL